MYQMASWTYPPQVFTSVHFFNKIIRSGFTINSPLFQNNWVKIHHTKNKVWWRFTNPEIYIPQDSMSRWRWIYADPWGWVQSAHWWLHEALEAAKMGIFFCLGIVWNKGNKWKDFGRFKIRKYRFFFVLCSFDRVTIIKTELGFG